MKRDSAGRPMLSRSAVSVLSERFFEQYQEFSQRDLSSFDIVYLFVDGVYESVKRYTKGQTLLCAWAMIEAENEKEALLSVPTLIRDKSKAIKIVQFDPNDVGQWDETK